MVTAVELLKQIEQEEESQEQVSTNVDSPETASATEKNFILETFGNIPGSAAQFGKDIITPILSPIETAKTIGELGKSVISVIRPGEQGNEELARQVGSFYVERYGGFERAKETIKNDPVGFFGDISLLFTGAGAGVKATGQATNVASKISKAGKFTDPAYGVARAGLLAGDQAGRAARGLVGTITGTGSAPYKQAIQGGAEFTQAMRGNIGETEIVNLAKSGLNDLKEIRNKEFKANQRKIYPSLQKTNVSSKTKDDLLNLVSEYRNQAKSESGISSIRSGGDIDSFLTDADKVIGQVSEVKNLEDLANVSQQLNELGQGLDFNSPAGSAAAKINQDFTNTLKDLAPDGYTEFLKTYATQSEEILQIIRELGLKDGRSISAAFAKISRAIRNPNSALGETLSKLDPKVRNELTQKVSGYLLSEALPPGLSRSLTAGLIGTATVGGAALGGPLGAAGSLGSLALVSPRLTGEATRAIGKLRKGAVGAGGLLRTPAQLSRQLGAQEQSELRKQGLL